MTHEYMKSDHQQRVEEFMRGAGQDIPDKPTLPDEETRLSRARLELEECIEKIRGLGFNVIFKGRYWVTPDTVAYVRRESASLEEIIDASCDQIVVATGTLSACGVPDIPFQSEVDLNNLAKIEGGHLDEHGKFIKPDDHQPPRIGEILRAIQEAT